MFRPINYRLVRWISVSILLLSACALGQFEIAPDHFELNSKPETVRRSMAKVSIKHGPTATTQTAGRANKGKSRATERNSQSSSTTRKFASKFHSSKNNRSSQTQVTGIAEVSDLVFGMF